MSRIARAASLITLAFALSRVLGYVRLKAMAFVFGATPETDAYTAAFSVPDLFYFLLGGGALSAAFIPVFNALWIRGRKVEAAQTAFSVACVLVGGAVVAVGLIEAFTPAFVRLLFPGFAGTERFEMCVRFTRALAPMLIFTVLSGVCTGILHSMKRFGPPAFAFLLYNLPIIAATFLLGPGMGAIGMVVGVLFGAAMLVFVQAPAVLKSLAWHFPRPLLNQPAREILRLFLPAMGGLAVSQVNLFIVPQRFATFLSEGMVTDVTYATRVILLPLGIFGMALSSAIFPFLSQSLTEGKQDDYRRVLAKGIRASFFFSLPSMAFLFLFAEPIMIFLFVGGEFGGEDARIAGDLLRGLSFGLVGMLASQVVIRGFHARKETKTPLYTGLFALGVNILLCLILLPRFEHHGVAIALSVSQLLALLLQLMLIFQRKELPGFLATLLPSLAKMLLAALFAAGLALLLSTWMHFEAASPGQTALPLGLLGAVFCLGYYAAARLLRCEEISQVHALLRRRP